MLVAEDKDRPSTAETVVMMMIAQGGNKVERTKSVGDARSTADAYSTEFMSALRESPETHLST